MKIAMVSEHASPLAVLGGTDAGGQHVHVAELSAALARRGHDVTVYTRRDDPDLPEEVEAPHGYTVVHVPAGPAEPLPKEELLQHMGPFAQYLDAHWDAYRPQVTHAHFWMSGIATQLAARHLGLPAVQTFHALGVVERRHQGAQDTSPPDRSRLEAMVARAATWVVATCSDEVFELMRMGRSRARTSVVPCGVDKDVFTPDGPIATKTAKHRILSVGRLVPRKGFDDMIRAMPSIPNAELIIAGGPDHAELASDPEAKRLRALAEELGVARRVHLYGAVARAAMPELFRSADVVACTPWYEPFGIVPLEAMASGVPVVASAVGGMQDTVVHDVTGRLIAPRKPREIADAINPLLRDAFLRQSLGLAGRDRVCARYTWDQVASDAVRIYDTVAQRDHPHVSTG
jgi:D-inositol-3-phosphate glycosyltransferase